MTPMVNEVLTFEVEVDGAEVDGVRRNPLISSSRGLVEEPEAEVGVIMEEAER